MTRGGSLNITSILKEEKRCNARIQKTVIQILKQKVCQSGTCKLKASSESPYYSVKQRKLLVRDRKGNAKGVPCEALICSASSGYCLSAVSCRSTSFAAFSNPSGVTSELREPVVTATGILKLKLCLNHGQNSKFLSFWERTHGARHFRSRRATTMRTLGSATGHELRI